MPLPFFNEIMFLFKSVKLDARHHYRLLFVYHAVVCLIVSAAGNAGEDRM
jgi:hypothetical protein